MNISTRHVIEACDYIKSRFSDLPVIGMLTGTGLSNLTNEIQADCLLEYSLIPHFPVSTVESHAGRLICGRIHQKPVLIFQGRFHLYEGYSPSQVTFPVRVMQALGIKTLILCNAAGGINLNFSPGQIMVIRDHMNLTGLNPLTGPNEETWGVRFPDMTCVYSASLIALAQTLSKDHDIPLQTGVYAGLPGPSLETPAETRYLKTIGADAVGFSTVMEAIAGVHADMRILGLSLITNINDPDHPQKTTLEGVIKTAQAALEPFSRLISLLFKHIPENRYI